MATTTTTQTTQTPYTPTQTGFKTTSTAMSRPAYWAIAIGVLIAAAAIFFIVRNNTPSAVESNAVTPTEQVRDVPASAPAVSEPLAPAPSTAPEMESTTPNTAQ